ncbi:MAG: hypothetical protein ABJB86_14940 [Bacteroidota bacterium]
MLPKLSILTKAASAVVMIAALLFLTTANFWAYGFKKEKQTISSTSNTSDEEQDSGSPVPNPVEEKNANTLQNLSEYLHDPHQGHITYFVVTGSFGNRHDVTNLPIHHPELITPPPKLG